MKNLLLFVCCTLLAMSCDDGYGFDSEREPQLVVEGWIEGGGFPVVLLTTSIPFSKNYQQTDSLTEHLLRWAKVTIADGSQSVVLTGKYDKGYFPPYIYTTSRMRGETGKTYTLTVDYEDFHATATTTIPFPPDGCKVKAKKVADSDTLYQVSVVFRDNPLQKNYYQLFCRAGETARQYLATYMGCMDDVVLSGETELPVYRKSLVSEENPSTYFKLDEKVSVKLATLDETSFRIWNSYSKYYSGADNMFLSMSSDVVSNVTGAYGYWCGYGAVTKYFVVEDIVE